MAHEIEYGLNTVSNFRLLNFATGSYTCKCCMCGKEFVGDKRATVCLACALKTVEEKFTSTNKQSVPPCSYCDDNYKVDAMWVCSRCGEKWGIENGTRL